MTEDLPKGRKQAALAFIFVTALLDVMALGIVIPVLPKLVESFTGSVSLAGFYVGLFGTLWGLMQFVFSPIMGGLSDRFGRRPVILASNFGLAIAYGLMALAPNLIWLLVARLVSGIMAASLTTAFAYVADITPPEKRTGAYGLVGASFGLGFVIGPVVGGLIGDFDPRWPFWLAGGLSLLNGLYGLMILPESLPKDKRSAFSWAKANPVGSLKLLGGNKNLSGLALVNFLAQFAHYALPTCFVLYAGARYGWGSKEVGYVLAVIGVCAALVQGVLARFVAKWIGERATVVVALSFGALGFLIYGIAPTGDLFLIGVPVMSLWGMAGPSTQSLMTQLVDPTQQGRLQGANMSLNALAGVIAPVIFGQSLSLVSAPGHPDWWLGAPFVLGSLFLGLASLQAMRMFAKLAKVSPKTP
ncbi:MAG: TCR/Tet family MFS transporter [Asticcacaulis sp.]